MPPKVPQRAPRDDDGGYGGGRHNNIDNDNANDNITTTTTTNDDNNDNDNHNNDNNNNNNHIHIDLNIDTSITISWGRSPEWSGFLSSVIGIFMGPLLGAPSLSAYMSLCSLIYISMLLNKAELSMDI